MTNKLRRKRTYGTVKIKEFVKVLEKFEVKKTKVYYLKVLKKS